MSYFFIVYELLFDIYIGYIFINYEPITFLKKFFHALNFLSPFPQVHALNVYKCYYNNNNNNNS